MTPPPSESEIENRSAWQRGFDALFGASRSAAVQACLAQVRRYAACEDELHLEGETGAGKTNLFEYIVAHSRRAKRIAQRLVLTGVTDESANSELFGHVRGAYTGAHRDRAGHLRQADGGTLFLDEIGKASPAVQRRLLEFLDSRHIVPLGDDRAIRVDCRIVTASNVTLDVLVRSEQFLPDLRYRVSTLTVRVPALRERREDIAQLFSFFVAQRVGMDPVIRDVPRVHPELSAVLTALPWNGNLRELRACAGRMVINNPEAKELTPAHFGEVPAHPTSADAPAPVTEIHSMLAACDGNISEAARRLRLHRSTLYRKLRLGGADLGAAQRGA